MQQAKAGVFLSSGASATPGGVVEAFLQAAGPLSLSNLDFSCASSAAGQPQDSQARYSLALLSCSSSSAASTSGSALATVSRRLLPGAVLYLHEQDASKGVQAVQRELLLNGFVEDQPVTSLPAHLGLMVRARRPDYEIGTKVPLKLKRPAAAAPPQPAAQPAAAPGTWQLNPQEGDEMMDDEELLTEEDKARPEVPAAGDCSTSKKACKNCSCGRAEKEAAGERVQLTQEMLDNPKSSCGSCTLGDAFRCAGCPYRGLPPFEQGKKIQLPSDFLTADA